MRPCPRCGGAERYRDGHCKPCSRTRKLADYYNNRDAMNAYNRAWLKANPEKNRAKARKAYSRRRHAAMAKIREWNLIVRDEVFKHYGDLCACCGETHREFFTIDHAYGNGAEERRARRNFSGKQLYAWLRSNNYPPGYRLLCMNCNFSLGMRGYCPHGNVKIEKASA